MSFNCWRYSKRVFVTVCVCVWRPGKAPLKVKQAFSKRDDEEEAEIETENEETQREETKWQLNEQVWQSPCLYLSHSFTLKWKN